MGKQSKEVRVIGGSFKGRKLFVNDPNVKPTPDRVRETLFNWLEPVITGSTVLDLFAGSGVLAIESLSRGAMSATLVDHSEVVSKSLEKLMLVLELSNYSNLCQDAHELVSKTNSSKPYSIIFLDPPYGVYELSELVEKLYKNKWANETTWIYCETNRPIKIDQNAKYHIFKESRAGEVYYALIKC